nr:hypothetical protein [Pyrinomonadaceae bacterium]
MAELLPKSVARLWRAPDERHEEPIREELYSVERLEQYAAVLAAEHKVITEPGRGRRLLPRLEENSRKLIASYRVLVEAIRNERAMSPAAEWFVDNFHIVEDQLREIREDLPKSYYHELPKLVAGEFAGYPRVYALAMAFIAHTDSHIEAETLRRFVRAYQHVAPLTVGELWAVAITLRLALVENLQRLATRIRIARGEREEADVLADKLLETAARQPSADAVVNVLVERLGKREKLGRTFVVHFAQRLRDQDPVVASALDWLERRLDRQGQTVGQVVQLEHQRQAAAQVTVGNIITSMRLLSTLDWRDIFESVSHIDELLREDPAGAYARMDFVTRDRYRHVIERIAKRSKATELEIAEHAIELAAQHYKGLKRHTENPQKDPATHVGYYLIGDGCKQLETHFAYRPLIGERLRRAALHHPTLAYLGGFVCLTMLILAPLVFYAFRSGAGPLLLIGFALLSLIPASDLALSVLNWDVTHLFQPRLLPKIDTSTGIPEDARTMVVVPTLFTSEETVRELLEKIEVHYLANQDEQLYFALLGDFADATKEDTPRDNVLLETALSGIERLNARYSSQGVGRFHLFHRRRRWNASEGKWMGWERKRGKLQEFNRLLRGAQDTSFIVATANKKFLQNVRFCITLDSDTQLPRDAARRLVGVRLHPLNRPHFDPRVHRVTSGYGILQPRVSIALTSAAHSIFARTFSGNTGIDPYTTAASDVYQDLFGEGSYTGKGLYDVDAFEAALAGQVPENYILSHDLFEGLHARCGLVTDIELLDEYPAQYDSYAKRQHRWTRGDWQLVRWLFPHVPDAHRQTVRNRLPLIARWKLFDNLRRSLVAPGLVLWLIMAWTLLPGSTVLWTLVIIFTLAFPVYAHVTTSLLLHPRGIPWTSHFWSVWGSARTNTAQIALTIIFLPHQAYVMADAIGRTLYRKSISHRHLLEWETAAQTERSSEHSLAATLRFMWPAELITGLIALIVLLLGPGAHLVALPFLLAWALSPFVAHYVSRRVSKERQPLTEKDRRMARLLARRTWRFFEKFVGSDDNWLPPDNFQEDPRPVIAHRTSPTNIGLLLLSTIAARDFGYTGTLEMIERLELSFATLGKLTRFNGHYLNWYDTQSLEPLAPQYVSTVDSGNLAGHLIAVKQACLQISDCPLFDARIVEGLTDTITHMRDEAARLSAVRQRTAVVSIKHLRDEIAACSDLVAGGTPQTLYAWSRLFDTLAARLAVIDDSLNALSHEHGESSYEELRFWISALMNQTRAYLRDLHALAPWGTSLVAHLTPVIGRCSVEA